MTAQPASRPLFSGRDFRIFLSGRLITELGSRITREGLPIVAVLAAHATAQDLGYMAALAYITALIGAPLAGVLADRRRRKPILIVSDLLRAGLLASITLAAVLHRLAFPQMLIVFGLVSGIGVFFDVADQAWLPSFAGRDRLEPANAALSAASAVGETGGPALMGILIQTLGGPWAIFTDAVSYCASAVSLGLIRKPEPPPATVPDGQNALGDAVRGMSALLRHPLLRPLALAVAMQNLSGGFFDALYEFYALKDLHLSPFVIGVLITAGGLGALFGAVVAPRVSRRFGYGPSLIAGALLYGLLTLLVPLAPTASLGAFFFLLAAQFLGDGTSTLFGFGEVVVRQSATPDRWLGRVSGAERFLGNLLGAVGALVAGVIAGAHGVRTALLLSALITLVSVFWLLFSPLVHLREAPAVDLPHFAG